VALSVSQS